MASKRQLNSNTDDGDDHDNDDDDNDDDDDDPGTSWFTEHNAPEKVLAFLTAEKFPLAPVNTNTNTNTNTQTQTEPGSEERIHNQPSILDIGTGNGSMLNLLRDEGGFTGSMVGVDYSDKSIELARRLASSGAGVSAAGPVRFEVFDVLDRGAVDVLVGGTTTTNTNTAATTAAASGNGNGNGNGGGGGKVDWFPSEHGGGFDIVLDKGTFDAISLSDEGNEGGERICERYPGAVARLVRKGGYFVITSCNWTESELVEWFTRAANTNKSADMDNGADADGGFVVYDRVEYPKFRFGGQEGQGVCTVCFQRR